MEGSLHLADRVPGQVTKGGQREGACLDGKCSDCPAPSIRATRQQVKEDTHQRRQPWPQNCYASFRLNPSLRLRSVPPLLDVEGRCRRLSGANS